MIREALLTGTLLAGVMALPVRAQSESGAETTATSAHAPVKPPRDKAAIPADAQAKPGVQKPAGAPRVGAKSGVEKGTAPARARSASAARPRATASAPVNINGATLAQLQTLPGVGASTAQRILDYRQKNGGFKKVEELMNVKGVGEKSFLKLKPFVVVNGDRSSGGEAQK